MDYKLKKVHSFRDTDLLIQNMSQSGKQNLVSGYHSSFHYPEHWRGGPISLEAERTIHRLSKQSAD